MPSATRSDIMRRIRSKNTGPEHVVRRYLHSKGFRFRLHRNDLPGHPDLVLPKYRTVVQVHGCFWHQHDDPNCPDSRIPDSNQSYWIPKLGRTVVRDRETHEALREAGWNVEVVWSCELDAGHLEALARRITARHR